jgi:pimeloyl-ACP methyl ester carboxylesterase
MTAFLPRSAFHTCEGYEIHVTEWGNPANPPVILWHGLARTGRDFDPLARLLADRYFLLAPDTLGRGLSQWANDAKQDYCLSRYGDIALSLLQRYGINRLRWVGTSMGGALGIHLAGGRLRERITHLVVNDIAPQLAATAVERILTYAGSPPTFDTIGQLQGFLRTVYAPYGWLPDSQWQHMAETSARRRDDGKITVHYDPMMVEQFRSHPHDYDQWDAWDKISAHALLLRGKDSDLILPAWAQEMTRRGPRAEFIEFSGMGHAPALNVPEQTGAIATFLAKG